MKDLPALIFFIHVPKTAGSSVNSWMMESLGDGFEHCESFIDKDELWRNRLQNAVWLSGHVNITKAKKRVKEAGGRPVRYFSCVRNPKEQVMSHLNWLIEIFHKSPRFFYDHPARVQEISHEIRSNGLHNKDSILHMLMKYRGLFMDNQAKMLMGDQFSQSPQNIAKAMLAFEYIGIDNNLDLLLSKIANKKVKSSLRENASLYHFQKELFEDPDVDYFLSLYNKIDISMFQTVSDRAQTAEEDFTV